MDVQGSLLGDQEIRLRSAILIYSGDNMIHDTFATVHEVEAPEAGPPTLRPGALLTREGLERLSRSLSNAPARRTILPGNVLVFDQVVMAWWVHESARPIFFNTSSREFNEAVNGKTVAHPPLVFMARAGWLSVFALRSDERPEAGTKLYRAPYMNLYETGAMCAGNTRLPDSLSVSDIPTWERAFWETNFTHTNLHGNERLTRFKGGHDALWRAMVTAGRFPAESLVALNTTLEQVVSEERR